MLKWYRSKKKDSTSEEINGSGEQLQKGQTKANLRMPSLHYFSRQYIQSEALEDLGANRATLVARRPQCGNTEKKKTHGLTDARGLNGTEIAALELKAREVLARKTNSVTPDTPEEEDGDLMLFGTPPRPAEESQGGTTIILASST